MSQEQGLPATPNASTGTPAKEQTITELESLEKFKFDGRELTPEQLRKERMLHSDYTKKTQEIAAEREFYSALPADLKAVRENPKLAAQFRQIYPKNFHHYLDFLGAAPARKSQDDPESDDSYELKSKLDRLEKYVEEQETAKNEAIVDRICAKYSAKFSAADEDLVLSWAQTLSEDGTQLTDVLWEKLWKQSHDRTLARDTQRQKLKFNKQKQANDQSLESSQGGGTPGQAPRKESMKEATERAVKELTGRGRPI